MVGGYALTLLHRHDIRVGIASGMYLKHHVLDSILRLELLAVLHLCYWRWSTRLVLLALAPHMDEYVCATSFRRAEILLKAWEAMEHQLSDYEVVSWRRQRKVELLKRSVVNNLRSLWRANQSEDAS